MPSLMAAPFATSDDGGQSWSPNVAVGAGLGGDQFDPQAVVDVASNVYVAFQDTTDGQKVVFSRFNEEGTFDPPLAPSTKGGQEGIVGDYPSVATDLFGTVYVAWEENRGGPAAPGSASRPVAASIGTRTSPSGGAVKSVRGLALCASCMNARKAGREVAPPVSPGAPTAR
ncbi:MULTISPECIES: hypothetical protein [Sorangium]|uniref:hypothetical protein n=1 Tax=Sorangium TaxID=39643 RepID=UPI003D9C3EBA